MVNNINKQRSYGDNWTAVAVPGEQRGGQWGGALAAGLSAIAAVLLLAGLGWWLLVCPCERMPGVYLSGEVTEQPVADWEFANTVPLCQIQTRPGVLPHAINLNCMAGPDGRLYLSCSQCEGKRWSETAQENPAGRLRLDDTVYPINLRRVTSEAELDRAWLARHRKLAALNDRPAGDPPERPGHWWSFEVSSRDS